MEQAISALNHLVRTTLELEQYQCGICKRFWYINIDDIEDEKCLDFGCPWGCDDAGKRLRNMITEISEVKDESKNSGYICVTCTKEIPEGELEISDGNAFHKGCLRMNKMIDERKKDTCSLCGNIKEKIDNCLTCTKCGYIDEGVGV